MALRLSASRGSIVSDFLMPKEEGGHQHAQCSCPILHSWSIQIRENKLDSLLVSNAFVPSYKHGRKRPSMTPGEVVCSGSRLVWHCATPAQQPLQDAPQETSFLGTYRQEQEGAANLLRGRWIHAYRCRRILRFTPSTIGLASGTRRPADHESRNRTAQHVRDLIIKNLVQIG